MKYFINTLPIHQMKFVFCYFQRNVLLYLICGSVITLSSCSPNERFHTNEYNIHIKYQHQLTDNSNDFQQTVDTSPFHDIEPRDCSNKSKILYCQQWGDIAGFKIIKINKACENYQYVTKTNDPLIVSFNITNDVHLYGGTEIGEQHWPSDGNFFDMQPFVSFPGMAVIEPYWLASSGFYLSVHEKVPLFITSNKSENVFRIIAKREDPYIRKDVTILNYTVCKFEDMKKAQEHAIIHKFGKPKGTPDFRMVELPVWSTWARYKSNISEKIVLDFANNIVHYGFPNSQLEIDDKWELCYGSLTVDKQIFPDMKKTVSQLKDMGFRVTLWVHPFVNVDCEPYYSEGKNSNYYVNSTKTTVYTTWWNGNGSCIDFTNPKAVTWWQNRLLKLREETGVDSFKFDAGESGWSPQVPIFNDMREDHPETILKAYIEAVSIFGSIIEVRAARGTHQYPTFVRMMDRETRWKGGNGFITIIPELLHMNIVGYPFVLPDMIGGNGYNGDVLTKELFLRWLQLNVFMPSMQFSYPPWELGVDVCEATKQYIDLHKKYAKKIQQLMEEATRSGTPVNRPIWWIDPTDNVTYTIDSEYLLGDDILVAPVIEEGATSRDIYLPKGSWKDEVTKDGKLIKGPTWLKNYPANLSVLPYFTKVESDVDSGAMSIIPMLMLIFVLALITLTT